VNGEYVAENLLRIDYGAKLVMNGFLRVLMRLGLR
jgi:hypothetical protein